MLIQALNNVDDKRDFDCGDFELNKWLHQVAGQHKQKRISSTFVAVDHENSAIVLGFYAISIAELINSNLPEQFRKRLPEKVPVFRLGRLGTDKQHHGKGIGEFMLFDAIDRVTRIATEVGGIGLIVNAKPSAVNFYQQYGFEPMSDHPQNLFLAL